MSKEYFEFKEGLQKVYDKTISSTYNIVNNIQSIDSLLESLDNAKKFAVSKDVNTFLKTYTSSIVKNFTSFQDEFIYARRVFLLEYTFDVYRLMNKDFFEGDSRLYFFMSSAYKEAVANYLQFVKTII